MDVFIAVAVAIVVFGLVGFAIYKTVKRKQNQNQGQTGSEAIEEVVGKATDAVEGAAKDAFNAAKDQANKL